MELKLLLFVIGMFGNCFVSVFLISGEWVLLLVR